MSAPLLQIDNLSLDIAGNSLCQGLNLQIQRNECWALLGRNGAGKTTLLQCLLRLRDISAGRIRVQGKNLNSIPRRQLAAQVGMLFQESVDALPATVIETVMLGRHPYSQSLLSDDEADIALARKALLELGLESFAQRRIDSLSGGERQRLALAMLLAQQPDLYLLDEPSNHLDIAFQTRLLDLLTTKIHDQGGSVIMATHDINLASRYCEKILLMLPKGKHLVGSRQKVLTEHNLSVAYGCEVRLLRCAEGPDFFYPA